MPKAKRLFRRRYNVGRLMRGLRGWPTTCLKQVRDDITRELLSRIRSREKREDGEG
jgi:hypothetical protein